MTVKEINESIEESQALKTIAAAYTEISSLRLRRIRAQVIRTRAFFVEVLNIYAMLKHLSSKKNPLSRPKTRPASIILTSNNRFYGHIESDLVQFFLNQTLEKGDIFVIGRQGKGLFNYLGLPFKSIIFKDDIPEPEELIQLVGMVKNYQAVLVYFARFRSVLNQVPAVVDITQSQAQAVEMAEQLELAYIFEPEVSKILEFFDSQLKQVLIEQTFLETELARTSSKLISMDQAQHNADEFLQQEHLSLIRAQRSIQNTRILETAASMLKKRFL